MNAMLRKTLVFGALAAVVAWSLELSRTPSEPPMNAGVVQAHPSGPAAAPTRAALAIPAAATNRAAPVRLVPTMLADLLPPQTWVPPPPPPPKFKPRPPEAPALPFFYLGSWHSGGQTIYYLQEGPALVGAKSGEVIDDVWRLKPAAHPGDLDVEYLPLKQMRTLRMGDTLAATPPANYPR